jgi:hypothetical protein
MTDIKLEDAPVEMQKMIRVAEKIFTPNSDDPIEPMVFLFNDKKNPCMCEQIGVGKWANPRDLSDLSAALLVTSIRKEVTAIGFLSEATRLELEDKGDAKKILEAWKNSEDVEQFGVRAITCSLEKRENESQYFAIARTVNYDTDAGRLLDEWLIMNNDDGSCGFIFSNLSDFFKREKR